MLHCARLLVIKPCIKAKYIYRNNHSGDPINVLSVCHEHVSFTPFDMHLKSGTAEKISNIHSFKTQEGSASD